MNEVDGLGDAVLGGALGRAVEPATGLDHGHTSERNCLNCGTALVGAYCYACGQHAHIHRTLAAFFHDLLHGVLHFEGKIWRTLPLLVRHPGQLTRRYIDGQRARFVSPIALFLFAVFLMFGVMSFSGMLDPPSLNQVTPNIQVAINSERERIATLESDRRERLAQGRSVVKIDTRLKKARDDLKTLDSVRNVGALKARKINFDNSVPQWMRNGIVHATENPELAIYKLQSQAYKFSWLLIPLSVPFLWLLFPFSRRFRFYDHTVFVTYSLAFMMGLVIFASLMALAGVSAAVLGFLFFVPPIHMYAQLRGAYGVSRFGALWRTIALVSFAFTAAILFVLVILGFGIAA